MHLPPPAINRIQQLLIFLLQGAPPQLARPGQLSFIGVEFLVQDHESPDLRISRQRLVDRAQLAADNVVHFLALRQIDISGEGDAPLLRPARDILKIDHDDRRDEIHIGAADSHHVLHVGAEFAAALDVLRAELFAGRQLNQVLDALQVDQVARLLVHVARVAGVIPALDIERLAGLLGPLVVAFETRSGADEDLLILRDLDLDPRHDDADRLEAHVPAQMHRAEGFGRAVELPQLNADGAEETDNIRAQHRARRQHIARPRQPQLVAQRLEDGVFAQPAQQAQRRRNRLMLVFQINRAISDRHE